MTTKRPNKLSHIVGAAAGAFLTLFAAATEPALAGVARGFSITGRAVDGVFSYAATRSIKSQSVLILSKDESFVQAVIGGVNAVVESAPYDISIVINSDLPIGDSRGKVIFFGNTVHIQGIDIDAGSFDGTDVSVKDMARKVARTLIENHRKYIAPIVVSQIPTSER
ncbi:MAG: hypothetical protein LRY39_00590 [Alphaproteobacteria bacterium]|nr:hypothetical protein [Alphaproteobacteria bacterium]